MTTGFRARNNTRVCLGAWAIRNGLWLQVPNEIKCDDGPAANEGRVVEMSSRVEPGTPGLTLPDAPSGPFDWDWRGQAHWLDWIPLQSGSLSNAAITQGHCRPWLVGSIRHAFSPGSPPARALGILHHNDLRIRDGSSSLLLLVPVRPSSTSPLSSPPPPTSLFTMYLETWSRVAGDMRGRGKNPVGPSHFVPASSLTPLGPPALDLGVPVLPVKGRPAGRSGWLTGSHGGLEAFTRLVASLVPGCLATGCLASLTPPHSRSLCPTPVGLPSRLLSTRVQTEVAFKAPALTRTRRHPS